MLFYFYFISSWEPKSQCSMLSHYLIISLLNIIHPKDILSKFCWMPRLKSHWIWAWAFLSPVINDKVLKNGKYLILILKTCSATYVLVPHSLDMGKNGNDIFLPPQLPLLWPWQSYRCFPAKNCTVFKQLKFLFWTHIGQFSWNFHWWLLNVCVQVLAGNQLYDQGTVF